MRGLLRAVSDVYYRLFGSAELRPYERACLDAWRAELAPGTREMLDGQLARYDLVLRYSSGKLVCFYCQGDPTCEGWPSSALFPLRSEDGPVASVVLSPAGGSARMSLKAEIVLFRGRLASIEFSRRPGDAFAPRVAGEDVKVSAVELLRDPMQAEECEEEPGCA